MQRLAVAHGIYHQCKHDRQCVADRMPASAQIVQFRAVGFARACFSFVIECSPADVQQRSRGKMRRCPNALDAPCATPEGHKGSSVQIFVHGGAYAISVRTICRSVIVMA